MIIDLKKSIDLRWLFDDQCYIHLSWSCFFTDTKHHLLRQNPRPFHHPKMQGLIFIKSADSHKIWLTLTEKVKKVPHSCSLIIIKSVLLSTCKGIHATPFHIFLGCKTDSRSDNNWPHFCPMFIIIHYISCRFAMLMSLLMYRPPSPHPSPLLTCNFWDLFLQGRTPPASPLSGSALFRSRHIKATHLHWQSYRNDEI